MEEESFEDVEDEIEDFSEIVREKCPCGCTQFQTLPSGETVCTNCGIIISEENLVNQKQPKGSFFVGTQYKLSKYEEKSKKHREKMFSELIGLYKLPPATQRKAINHFHILTGGKFKQGKKADLISGGIIYAFCRIYKKPVTILDIADKIDCDVIELGREYLRIIQTLKLQIPVIDPVHYVDEYCSRLSIPQDKLKTISNQAIRIVNISKADWLTLGRKPIAIVASALILALQGNELQVEYNYILKELAVKDSTVKKRLAELKKSLIKIGKELLPWGSEISSRNFSNQLPFILKILQIYYKRDQVPVHLNSLPPAFEKSEAKRNERIQKLKKAKERIENPQSQETQTLDKEDSLIEGCLRAGIDERSLIDGYYFCNSVSSSPTPTKNLFLEDLSEEDFPAQELQKLVRSKEEVNDIATIYSFNTPTSVSKTKSKNFKTTIPSKINQSIFEGFLSSKMNPFSKNESNSEIQSTQSTTFDSSNFSSKINYEVFSKFNFSQDINDSSSPLINSTPSEILADGNITNNLSKKRNFENSFLSSDNFSSKKSRIQ